MSFASFPVEQLGLSTEQLRLCTRAQLSTASDILLPSPGDLARKLRPSCGSGNANDVARALVESVNRALMPVTRRASAMPKPDDVRIEGSEFVCRVGAITELVGESAAGKSHLTMSLALSAQIPSLSTNPGGCLMLTSERPLVTSRLVEMAEAMLARQSGPPLQEMLDNIQATSVKDIESLEHALTYVVPPLLARWRASDGSALLGQDVVPLPSDTTDTASNGSHDNAEVPVPRRRGKTRKPIRLLIIDSLTALFRGETELTGTSLAQRSRHLCALADRLKALAVEYALAVVVVNQVSDVFQREGGSDGPQMTYSTQARFFSGTSAMVRKEASLGIVWANCVNTRIMLGRTGRRRVITPADFRPDAGTGARKRKREENGENGGEQAEEEMSGVIVEEAATLIRRMHQVFSAFGPPGTVDYVLTPSGVHVLPRTYKVIDLGPALRRRAAQSTDSIDATQNTQIDPGIGDLPEDFWDLDADGAGEEGLAVGVVD